MENKAMNATRNFEHKFHESNNCLSSKNLAHKDTMAVSKFPLCQDHASIFTFALDLIFICQHYDFCLCETTNLVDMA